MTSIWSAAVGIMAVSAVIVSGAAAFAKTTWLSATELKTTFSGKTINGGYPGGRKFIERYSPNGTLQYEDPNFTSRGKWSITGQTFCTFYDNPGMGGACFLVTRGPSNCIEYFQVSDQPGPGSKPPKPAQTWGARGVIAGEKGSCVDSQSAEMRVR